MITNNLNTTKNSARMLRLDIARKICLQICRQIYMQFCRPREKCVPS
jgi:hypothetical protein